MDEGARGISTSDHLATWDPPPTASRAWEDICSIAGVWPAVSRWLRPAGRQAASGLRLIPLLRCAAVARALREASIGPRPDDLDDAVAAWIAAMLPHGALSPETLQRVAASALRDAAGRGLSYPGRGAISVGAAPEVTSLHARPSRALSFRGALTLELEAAHPCASSSGECGVESRTYLVASGLQPAPDGEAWVLGFREVMLAPRAFEALRGTSTGRWQRALDEQGAAEVAGKARALGLPDGEKPWRRLISSFTGRGSREHWLAPSIEEVLTTSARSAFAEVPDGRAIAETLARAVGMMEQRLCRLYASPRPVISLDLALDSTAPGAAPADERGGSRPLAVACFGDNLDVLRSLGPGLKGRVDGVYIDPPYDTGGRCLLSGQLRRGPVAVDDGGAARRASGPPAPRRCAARLDQRGAARRAAPRGRSHLRGREQPRHDGGARAPRRPHPEGAPGVARRDRLSRRVPALRGALTGDAARAG